MIGDGAEYAVQRNCARITTKRGEFLRLMQESSYRILGFSQNHEVSAYIFFSEERSLAGLFKHEPLW